MSPMNPRLLRPIASATVRDPLQIENCVAWLDGADTSTLFQNSNGTTAVTATDDPVGRWANKAGSPNALQTINNNRPLYKPGTLNGKGTLFYDGLAHFMSLAYDLASPFTLFSVSQCATSGVAFATIGNLQSGGQFSGLLHAHALSSNSTVLATRVRAGGTAFATGTSDIGANFFLWTSSVSGAVFRARANSTQLTDGSGTYGLRDAAIALGRSRVGDAVNNRELSIAEVVIYSRQLLDAEISRVESYLRRKWAI
jgi:hypothetical protein